MIEMSESTEKIAAALAAAQAQFPAIGREKSATVPMKKGGKFRYSYASLDAILMIVRPILASHEVALLQPHSSDGRTSQITTMLIHSSGQWIRASSGFQTRANPQEQGGAITYRRRYDLQAILGLATDEDNDAAHVGPATVRPAPRPATRPAPTAKRIEQPRPSVDAFIAAAEPMLSAMDVEPGEFIAWLQREGKSIDDAPRILSWLERMSREEPKALKEMVSK